MSLHRDYETLVAAHLLRSPAMATMFGPLIKKVEGRFFQEFFLRDVVLYSLNHFEATGLLLPPASLKVDVQLFGRDGASQDNYDLEIDRVWEVPDETLKTSQVHVKERLVSEVQARVLLSVDLHEYCSVSDLPALWELLEDVRGLGALESGGARRFSEGLREALTDPPKGVPIGFGNLKPAAGETVILFGRYGIGKSISLHHAVRTTALANRVCLLWSFETSQKNTELRLAKGFLDWPDEKLRAYPMQAHKEYIERWGDLPLYVHYSPPGTVTKAVMVQQLDRIEQEVGEKVELLAVDYSEKRAKGRDWNQVCDAYQELRELCGERGMVGLDVAQENQSGGISYFNLLKDADIGVQLTVLEPDEWRRRQRSSKDDDKAAIKIPTAGPVWAEVVRQREGESGAVFELWVDRATGRISRRSRGGEE